MDVRRSSSSHRLQTWPTSCQMSIDIFSKRCVSLGALLQHPHRIYPFMNVIYICYTKHPTAFDVIDIFVPSTNRVVTPWPPRLIHGVRHIRGFPFFPLCCSLPYKWAILPQPSCSSQLVCALRALHNGQRQHHWDSRAHVDLFGYMVRPKYLA